MKLYLDVCCLNRPFDDQRQDRVRLEAEAVFLVLSRIEDSEWEWVGSDVVDAEIAETPNEVRLSRLRLLADRMARTIIAGSGEFQRAAELTALGFKAIDALHMACAERAAADVLLTTDDRFLRAAKRHADKLNLPVRNPVVWLQEVLEP